MLTHAKHSHMHAMPGTHTQLWRECNTRPLTATVSRHTPCVVARCATVAALLREVALPRAATKSIPSLGPACVGVTLGQLPSRSVFWDLASRLGAGAIVVFHSQACFVQLNPCHCQPAWHVASRYGDTLGFARAGAGVP